MQGGNTAGKQPVSHAAETRLAHHRGKRIGVGKTPDAFDQVTVRFFIPGNDAAQGGHDGKRITVIEGGQNRRIDPAEFEAEKPPARGEDPIHLGQGFAEIGDVAQTKSNRAGVDRPARDRKIFRRAADETQIPHDSAVKCPGSPDLHHRLVDVADDGFGSPLSRSRLTLHPRQKTQGNVAGSAGDIEKPHARLRRQPIEKRLLPQPMNAERHQVVHQIIAIGDAIEDGADKRGFIAGADPAEAEVGGDLRPVRSRFGSVRVHRVKIAQGRHPRLYVPAMPELPEVETVRRALAARLVGRRLTRVEARRPDLRKALPRDLAGRLIGRKITGIERRAKYLLLNLDDGQALIAHLGMSGRMLLYRKPPPPGPHDHVILGVDDGTFVYFNDARRFGLMALADQNELFRHPLLKDLGIEPLGPGFNAPNLREALKNRATTIKAALLDQHVIAGLGNIYASEALFRAGISPRRRARSLGPDRLARLVTAICAVLNDAIAAGGSTLRDHRQPDGELGYFQHNFTVYGREGEACPGCDCDVAATGGIKRIVQAGRATFYCPRRQR
jgi:formamidopyrimidine-DNA glycosylase